MKMSLVIEGTKEELTDAMAKLGGEADERSVHNVDKLKGKKRPADEDEDEEGEEHDDESENDGDEAEADDEGEDEDEVEADEDDAPTVKKKGEGKKGPSLDDVLSALRDYAKENGKDAANKILKKFGVKSAHDLDESDYPKMLKKLAA